MARIRLLTSLAVVLALAHFQAALAADEGRGADSYPHKSVRKSEIGEGPRSYILFEPDDPRPDRAPVVVFTHGWLAMNPGVYGAWINHLVRRGTIVIYPRYMESETPITEFLPNTLDAIVDAFDVLQTSPSHIKADRSRFGLVGHSTGGVLAAQVAAMASDRGLPEPKAVIAVTPGELVRSKGPKLSSIPAETLLVVVAAEHDVVTGDGRARQIYREATSVPPARKRFVLFRTDIRGRPAFWADHLAPTASLASFDNGDGPFHDFQMYQGATNAIDREGFWKVTDLALAAGFAGKTLDDITRPGVVSLGLGYWSDGRPVISPIVTGDLSTVPRVVPAHGFRLFPWTLIDFPKP
jgi:acetyl esterase/lipase